MGQPTRGRAGSEEMNEEYNPGYSKIPSKVEYYKKGGVNDQLQKRVKDEALQASIIEKQKSGEALNPEENMVLRQLKNVTNLETGEIDESKFDDELLHKYLDEQPTSLEDLKKRNAELRAEIKAENDEIKANAIPKQESFFEILKDVGYSYPRTAKKLGNVAKEGAKNVGESLSEVPGKIKEGMNKAGIPIREDKEPEIDAMTSAQPKEEGYNMPKEKWENVRNLLDQMRGR